VQVIWHTAMSMDGRIASRDQSLGFLDAIGDQEAALAEFPAFLATIDAVVVGATTMGWLLGEGHGWPHDDHPTWLISHDERLAETVRPTRAELRRVAGDVSTALDAIEAAGHKRVWLAGGGSIAAQIIALDRLDEVAVTIAPTALGAAPSLFDSEALPRRTFRLVECTSIAGNAARLRWIRHRPGA